MDILVNHNIIGFKIENYYIEDYHWIAIGIKLIETFILLKDVRIYGGAYDLRSYILPQGLFGFYSTDDPNIK